MPEILHMLMSYMSHESKVFSAIRTIYLLSVGYYKFYLFSDIMTCEFN